MSGGKREVHRDSEYLMTGTHKRGTSVTLCNPGADFASCGAMDGLYIENTTQGTNSIVRDCTETMLRTNDNITWLKGNTYKIYKTGTKGSIISSVWVDLSRGWKTDPKEMTDGWKNEDIDLDKDGKKVFGTGQPEGK